MVGLNPLSNMGEKVASYVKLAGKELLQTAPIKWAFKGRNLAPLEKDTLNLESKPKIVKSFAADKLKKFYKHKGVPFLLPNQEWSDKKILDTINLLGKDLDKLVESKTLNKETLQKAVVKLVPEMKGKIIIKDFADLEKDLKALGKSDEIVNHYLYETNALTSNTPKYNKLYFKFEQLNEGKDGPIILKSDIEHELEHGFYARLQNTTMTNSYKNMDYKCHGQNTIFNKIFSVFEGSYYNDINLTQIELTQENMLKKLGFNSIQDLHNDFEKGLNNIIEESKSTGELNIGTDKKSWKQFFNYLKGMAKDEKQAYLSNKRYREIYKDTNTPTNAEFDSSLYGEMEKFFEKKRIQANKQFS